MNSGQYAKCFECLQTIFPKELKMLRHPLPREKEVNPRQERNPLPERHLGRRNYAPKFKDGSLAVLSEPDQTRLN